MKRRFRRWIGVTLAVAALGLGACGDSASEEAGNQQTQNATENDQEFTFEIGSIDPPVVSTESPESVNITYGTVGDPPADSTPTVDLDGEEFELDEDGQFTPSSRPGEPGPVDLTLSIGGESKTVEDGLRYFLPPEQTLPERPEPLALPNIDRVDGAWSRDVDADGDRELLILEYGLVAESDTRDPDGGDQREDPESMQIQAIIHLLDRDEAGEIQAKKVVKFKPGAELSNEVKIHHGGGDDPAGPMAFTRVNTDESSGQTEIELVALEEDTLSEPVVDLTLEEGDRLLDHTVVEGAAGLSVAALVVAEGEGETRKIAYRGDACCETQIDLNQAERAMDMSDDAAGLLEGESALRMTRDEGGRHTPFFTGLVADPDTGERVIRYWGPNSAEIRTAELPLPASAPNANLDDGFSGYESRLADVDGDGISDLVVANTHGDDDADGDGGFYSVLLGETQPIEGTDESELVVGSQSFVLARDQVMGARPLERIQIQTTNPGDPDLAELWVHFDFFGGVEVSEAKDFNSTRSNHRNIAFGPSGLGDNDPDDGEEEPDWDGDVHQTPLPMPPGSPFSYSAESIDSETEVIEFRRATPAVAVSPTETLTFHGGTALEHTVSETEHPFDGSLHSGPNSVLAAAGGGTTEKVHTVVVHSPPTPTSPRSDYDGDNPPIIRGGAGVAAHLLECSSPRCDDGEITATELSAPDGYNFDGRVEADWNDGEFVAVVGLSAEDEDAGPAVGLLSGGDDTSWGIETVELELLPPEHEYQPGGLSGDWATFYGGADVEGQPWTLTIAATVELGGSRDVVLGEIDVDSSDESVSMEPTGISESSEDLTASAEPDRALKFQTAARYRNADGRLRSCSEREVDGEGCSLDVAVGLPDGRIAIVGGQLPMEVVNPSGETAIRLLGDGTFVAGGEPTFAGITGDGTIIWDLEAEAGPNLHEGHEDGVELGTHQRVAVGGDVDGDGYGDLIVYPDTEPCAGTIEACPPDGMTAHEVLEYGTEPGPWVHYGRGAPTIRGVSVDTTITGLRDVGTIDSTSGRSSYVFWNGLAIQ